MPAKCTSLFLHQHGLKVVRHAVEESFSQRWKVKTNIVPGFQKSLINIDVPSHCFADGAAFLDCSLQKIFQVHPTTESFSENPEKHFDADS